MQFAKNIPKPKLLPPKQVVLGTNRCFGWQVLPGPSVKPSRNANWYRVITRATCFSFGMWSEVSRSCFTFGMIAIPISQTDVKQLGRSWSLRQKPWRRTRQGTAGAEVGFKASSWFTLWSWWDTQLKGHMRPTSDNMKKNTSANYAYESLWIVYSPEDAPVTICQLRLPGLIKFHIIFSIFFKSNLLFYFLIFSGCRWIEHIDFYPCRPDRRLWSGKTWGVRWGYLLIAGRIWEVRLHWEPCEFATSQQPSIVLLREILFFHFFRIFSIFSIS